MKKQTLVRLPDAFWGYRWDYLTSMQEEQDLFGVRRPRIHTQIHLPRPTR